MPDHWMSKFFYAQTYLELQMNEEALAIYDQLANSGFSESTYLKAQTAIAWNNLRRNQLYRLSRGCWMYEWLSKACG